MFSRRNKKILFGWKTCLICSFADNNIDPEQTESEGSRCVVEVCVFPGNHDNASFPIVHLVT